MYVTFDCSPKSLGRQSTSSLIRALFPPAHFTKGFAVTFFLFCSVVITNYKPWNSFVDYSLINCLTSTSSIGIVKFKIKLGAVPVIEASASLPGSPVVTVPITSVGVGPPAGPVGPVHTLKSESK